MELFIMILIIISIILFAFSFFLPDSNKLLKAEIDQLSLDLYQESYKIKKRIKVLEEELLMPNMSMNQKKLPALNPIIINQVLLLDKQGLPIDKIAKQSALSVDEVRQILENKEGMKLE